MQGNVIDIDNINDVPDSIYNAYFLYTKADDTITPYERVKNIAFCRWEEGS